MALKFPFRKNNHEVLLAGSTPVVAYMPDGEHILYDKEKNSPVVRTAWATLLIPTRLDIPLVIDFRRQEAAILADDRYGTNRTVCCTDITREAYEDAVKNSNEPNDVLGIGTWRRLIDGAPAENKDGRLVIHSDNTYRNIRDYKSVVLSDFGDSMEEAADESIDGHDDFIYVYDEDDKDEIFSIGSEIFNDPQNKNERRSGAGRPHMNEFYKIAERQLEKYQQDGRVSESLSPQEKEDVIFQALSISREHPAISPEHSILFALSEKGLLAKAPKADQPIRKAAADKPSAGSAVYTEEIREEDLAAALKGAGVLPTENAMNRLAEQFRAEMLSKGMLFDELCKSAERLSKDLDYEEMAH